MIKTLEAESVFCHTPITLGYAASNGGALSLQARPIAWCTRRNEMQASLLHTASYPETLQTMRQAPIQLLRRREIQVREI
jgi:hypothetical protein